MEVFDTISQDVSVNIMSGCRVGNPVSNLGRGKEFFRSQKIQIASRIHRSFFAQMMPKWYKRLKEK
jgi:hypothetical protein